MTRRYGRALIVGKFAPFHRGHQYLVEQALALSAGVTVLVYATPDFVAMPNALRAGWVRAIYPSVDVAVPEDPPADDADDPTHRLFVKEWLARKRISIDVVFSSEAYGPGFAETLGVAHEMVDARRLAVPVSGWQVRADLAAHRDMLHPVVLNDIAGVTGLEKRAGR